MRTRCHDWFDTKTEKVLYGIQVFVEGEWKNFAEDWKPFLVLCPIERDTKRKELRKVKHGS